MPQLLIGLAVGFGAIWAWRSIAPSAIENRDLTQADVSAASQPDARSPGLAATTALPTQGVLEILAAPTSGDWRVVRLATNPSIVVLEFPGLTEQGKAMNRLAAMFEKRNGDRGRVLTDAEMERLLVRGGDSVASFYQGHDYTGAMLARFFSLAAAQGVRLTSQESRLLSKLIDAGVLQASGQSGFSPLGTQAVVSFTAVQEDDPGTDADETVDGRRRESILLHELSHGEYFTNPAYREHCRTYWRRQLTERERQLFRRYLDRLDYDPRDEDLMINETQALLMHTPDTRAFNAAGLGVNESELARLRSLFR